MQLQLAVIRQVIADRDLERPRIAALAIRTRIVQLEPARSCLSAPHAVMEAAPSAMDMILLVRAAVQLELVRLAINDGPATCDAVGMPSDDAAHARIILLIDGSRAIAEHDIERLRVRRAPGHEPGTIVCDIDLLAGRVAQRIELHRRTIAQ